MEAKQVAIETIEQLVRQQESNFENLQGLSRTYQAQSNEYRGFQLQIMKSLRWRMQSPRDGLEEQINFAAYPLTQLDGMVWAVRTD